MSNILDDILQQTLSLVTLLEMKYDIDMFFSNSKVIDKKFYYDCMTSTPANYNNNIFKLENWKKRNTFIENEMGSYEL